MIAALVGGPGDGKEVKVQDYAYDYVLCTAKPIEFSKMWIDDEAAITEMLPKILYHRYVNCGPANLDGSLALFKVAE